MACQISGRKGGRCVRTFVHLWCLVTVIGVLLITWIAVRCALQAECFRRVAVTCRSNHLRMQGKVPVREEVEREVLQMADEIKRGE